MQVVYCDLCNMPIKKEHYFLQIVASDTTVKTYDIIKEIKDVCPNCKDLLEKVFKKRLKYLQRLSKNISRMYEEKNISKK